MFIDTNPNPFFMSLPATLLRAAVLSIASVVPENTSLDSVVFRSSLQIIIGVLYVAVFYVVWGLVKVLTSRSALLDPTDSHNTMLQTVNFESDDLSEFEDEVFTSPRVTTTTPPWDHPTRKNNVHSNTQTKGGLSVHEGSKQLLIRVGRGMERRVHTLGAAMTSHDAAHTAHAYDIEDHSPVQPHQLHQHGLAHRGSIQAPAHSNLSTHHRRGSVQDSNRDACTSSTDDDDYETTNHAVAAGLMMVSGVRSRSRAASRVKKHETTACAPGHELHEPTRAILTRTNSATKTGLVSGLPDISGPADTPETLTQVTPENATAPFLQGKEGSHGDATTQGIIERRLKVALAHESATAQASLDTMDNEKGSDAIVMSTAATASETPPARRPKTLRTGSPDGRRSNDMPALRLVSLTAPEQKAWHGHHPVRDHYALHPVRDHYALDPFTTGPPLLANAGPVLQVESEQEGGVFNDHVYTDVYGLGFSAFVLHYTIDCGSMQPTIFLLVGLTVLGASDVSSIALSVADNILPQTTLFTRALTVLSFILLVTAQICMLIGIVRVPSYHTYARDGGVTMIPAPETVLEHMLARVLPIMAPVSLYLVGRRNCVHNVTKTLRRAMPTTVFIALWFLTCFGAMSDQVRSALGALSVNATVTELSETDVAVNMQLPLLIISPLIKIPALLAVVSCCLTRKTMDIVSSLCVVFYAKQLHAVRDKEMLQMLNVALLFACMAWVCCTLRYCRPVVRLVANMFAREDHGRYII